MSSSENFSRSSRSSLWNFSKEKKEEDIIQQKIFKEKREDKIYFDSRILLLVVLLLRYLHLWEKLVLQDQNQLWLVELKRYGVYCMKIVIGRAGNLNDKSSLKKEEKEGYIYNINHNI